MRKTRPGFLKSEKGSATVEAVLWLPLFIALFGLLVDASLIFFGQSKVLRVIQDGNRNMSIGRLATEAETESYIEQQLAALDIVADAQSTVTAGVVRTDVRVAANQLQALGYFSSLLNLTLVVSSEHMIENWEA